MTTVSSSKVAVASADATRAVGSSAVPSGMSIMTWDSLLLSNGIIFVISPSGTSAGRQQKCRYTGQENRARLTTFHERLHHAAVEPRGPIFGAVIHCGGLEQPDRRPRPLLTMEAGDVVVFPHGEQHTMGSHGAMTPTPLASMFSPGKYDEPPRLTFGGAGERHDWCAAI